MEQLELGGNSGGSAGCCGTVFKLTPSGQEIILYTFKGKNDGGVIDAGVVMDSDGNLYGTAAKAGVHSAGVVWELSPAGQFTVLYSFTGNADGGNPYNGLARDSAGNLYGTTVRGGPGGEGVVYKITPTGQETVLYNFTTPKFTGLTPPTYGNPDVMLDSAGNLYGESPEGGQVGMIYKIDTAGAETTLYTFTLAPAGDVASVAFMNEAGEIYGTTAEGGAWDYGAIFKADAMGNETVLYSFTGGDDGSSPNPGIARDTAGNLYGTTYSGGSDAHGVLFELEPSGKLKVLHAFTEENDSGLRDRASRWMAREISMELQPAGGLQAAAARSTNWMPLETTRYSILSPAGRMVPIQIQVWCATHRVTCMARRTRAGPTEMA